MAYPLPQKGQLVAFSTTCFRQDFWKQAKSVLNSNLFCQFMKNVGSKLKSLIYSLAVVSITLETFLFERFTKQ